MDIASSQTRSATPRSISWKTMLFSLSVPNRISRAEYWLCGVLPVGAVWVVLSLFGLIEKNATGQTISAVELIGTLFLCWPGSVVILKRMRDRNLSLWWLLLLLVPIIGIFYAVWLTVLDLGCIRGTVGRNQYGEAPAERLAATAGWPVRHVGLATVCTVVVCLILSAMTTLQIYSGLTRPEMVKLCDEVYKAFL